MTEVFVGDHRVQIGVTSGHQEYDERRGELRMSQGIREDVADEMVHWDKRDA